MLVTKQNGIPVIIDDDSHSGDGGRNISHKGPSRVLGWPWRVSAGQSGRSGSPTHVYDGDDQCTGLIAPNGMGFPEKPWTRNDQNGRHSSTCVSSLAGTHTSAVRYAMAQSTLVLFSFEVVGLGCSNESCGGMSRSRRPSRHSSSRSALAA